MGTILVLNKSPKADQIVDNDTLISFDVVSDDFIKINSTEIIIEGNSGFDGYNFISPYNGASSSFSAISIGLYDGYHFQIEKTSIYEDGIIDIEVLTEDASDGYGTRWAFLVGGSLNVLYFSDGYGVKKIEVYNLAGESETKTRTVLSETTIPAVYSNYVSFIHTNKIDEYYYLVASSNGITPSLPIEYCIWGEFIIGAPVIVSTIVAKNEINVVNRFAPGMASDKAQINNRGILYLINKTFNQIEVYYGAHFRDGYLRSPDYIYNTTSTPAIMAGTILDLYIIDDISVRYTGGTRLFVGTTLGMTRIEAYDKESSPGYPDGMDGYGLAVNYGIVGSGATYEVIGGTVPSVVKISSDISENIILVVTNDGYGFGGLTQLDLRGNRKILFMTKENGLLPSDGINDVFGKL